MAKQERISIAILIVAYALKDGYSKGSQVLIGIHQGWLLSSIRITGFYKKWKLGHQNEQ